MKRYSLLAFLLVASVAFALAPVTNTSGFRPAGTVIKKVIGSDTFVYEEVNASGETRVSGSVTIGSFTFNPDAPFTVYTGVSSTSSAVQSTITPLAGRQFCTLINVGSTDIVWTNPGGTVATVGYGIPIYPGQYWSDRVDPAVTIPYISSTTVNVTVYQGR